MAVIHGYEGSVTFANGYVLGAHSWSLEIDVSIHDITGFADYAAGGTWRKKLSGLKDWRGTYTCRWDSSADPTASLGSGDEGTATFQFDESTTDGSIAGPIIISNINPTVDLETENTISFTFEGNGAITYTAPS